MKTMALILSFCLTLVLAGCNTMEGIGKDVEAAGDAIENSAKDNKRY